MPKGEPEQAIHTGIQEAGRKTMQGVEDELLYLQEFQSMGHFKRELMEYSDHHGRRIKTKRKGLPPAIRRQQALSVA